MRNLETELKSGVSRFSAYGKVSIGADTFPAEDSRSASGYVYKRAAFPVKIGSNNSIYVQMMGGHTADDPGVYVRNKDGEFFEIKWDLRDNEAVLDNVSDRSFITMRLEKDAEGKLVEKKFVSEYDAINYMAEHLHNDDQVYIGGNVEYRKYNGQIQRSFNITTVALDDKNEPVAELLQTYLIDGSSVPRNWEKQLEENYELTINAFVPQYVGKQEGRSIKKVLAFPQTMTLKATDDNLEKRKMIVKKFLMPEKGVVREIGMRNTMIDGYEESTGNVELTPELKELIELGFMTEEEVKKEATISGRRIHQTVFGRPLLHRENGVPKLSVADRYTPEALVVETDDEENVTTNDPFTSADESNDESNDNSLESEINAMFS